MCKSLLTGTVFGSSSSSNQVWQCRWRGVYFQLLDQWQVYTCVTYQQYGSKDLSQNIYLLCIQVSRSADQHPAFFAVYNMETTEFVAFYQVSFHPDALLFYLILHINLCESRNYFLQNFSEELYKLYEHFYDHFHATSRNSLHANFISSHSNNVHALDQICNLRHKANNSQVSLSLI